MPNQIPIYELIQSEITNDIKTKVYKPNEKLPTEKILMDKYKVSRMTIRKILANLISEDLIYQIKGKGVFVQKEMFQKTVSLMSFREYMISRDIVPSSKVMEIRLVIPDEFIRLSLGMEVNQKAYRVIRELSGDNEPITFETSYLPHDIFPNIDQLIVDNSSIYEIMRRVYHTKLKYIKQTITATKTDEEVSDFLYGKKTGFALKVVGIVYDSEGVAIQYGASYYHAERYSYYAFNGNGM